MFKVTLMETSGWTWGQSFTTTFLKVSSKCNPAELPWFLFHWKDCREPATETTLRSMYSAVQEYQARNSVSTTFSSVDIVRGTLVTPKMWQRGAWLLPKCSRSIPQTDFSRSKLLTLQESTLHFQDFVISSESMTQPRWDCHYPRLSEKWILYTIFFQINLPVFHFPLHLFQCTWRQALVLLAIYLGDCFTHALDTALCFVCVCVF
jgi:hypothetical protein